MAPDSSKSQDKDSQRSSSQVCGSVELLDRLRQRSRRVCKNGNARPSQDWVVEAKKDFRRRLEIWKLSNFSAERMGPEWSHVWNGTVRSSIQRRHILHDFDPILTRLLVQLPSRQSSGKVPGVDSVSLLGCSGACSLS